MMKKLICYSLIFFFSSQGLSRDAILNYTDESLTYGLGLGFSKMEMFTEIGNYFLLSNNNPILFLQYDSELSDSYKYKIRFHLLSENFSPENPSIMLKEIKTQVRGGLSFEPTWYSEAKTFSYGLFIQLKTDHVLSEVPTTAILMGDVDDHYTYEVGVQFGLYGKTVSKNNLHLIGQISYLGTLADHSTFDYQNGYSTKFTLDFNFDKKSLFSQMNLQAFYYREEIKSDMNELTRRDLGLTIGRRLSF